MEKIIGCFALGALIVFSSHAFALEEVLVTGTQRSVDLGNPNYNDPSNRQNPAPSVQGGPHYPPEHKQAMEQQAAQKQKAKQDCRAAESTRNHGALLVKNECVKSHTYAANAKKSQCSQVVQATTEVTVTLDTKVINGTATASQVETPRDTCRQQIDDQLDLDKIECNNVYDKATPPMNCDRIQ